MILHQRVHENLDVEGCFGCRVASVSVAASAMPTRGGDALWLAEREKRWNRDLPAYKRLRQNGVQPGRVDGSGDLEARANDQVEVETGQVLNRKQARQASAILSELDG